ncbi:MAG TPA: PAS domain S-box protein [Blastocatellia bacterium]|nr:PAS domain S-box protein [Blastocatellia bacterium]
MPANLKEQLFTWLSRFCEVRYCVARHCAFLMGYGRVAGEADAPPLFAEQALALLKELMPAREELPEYLRVLEETRAPLGDWPDFDSGLGRRFRVACAVVFLDPSHAAPWLRALLRLLGPRRYEQLMLFLAFVRTAHFWTEVHPELEFDPDLEAMMREHEALAAPLLRGADEIALWELGQRLSDEIESLRKSRKNLDAIRESEARFRATFENAAVGIARVAPDGRWLDVNQRLCDIVGYTREELIAKTFGEITHPDDLEADWKQRRLLLAGEVESLSIEKRYFRKDGSIVWVNVTVSLARKADGSPDYFISVHEDITARKLAEEKLRLFIQHAPAALAMFDRDMRYLAASRRWMEDYGLGDGDLTGQYHYEIFHEIPEHWLAAHRRALEGEVVRADDDCFAWADGSVQWLQWETRPWYAANGAIGGIVIFTEDVTERRRAEESLRASELRFRTMVSAVPSLSFETDADGHNTFASDQWCAYTGMTAEETAGRGFARAFHPDDAEDVTSRWFAAVQSGTLFESRHRIRAADGSYRWFLARALPGRDAEGRIVRWAGSLVDIDDLIRAEDALRESNDRLAGIVSSAMDAIITVDDSQRIVLFNAAAERMFGCPSAEAIGRPLGRFIPKRFRVTHASRIRRFGETEDMSQAMGSFGALSALRADGMEFPVEASISSVEVGGGKLYTVILRDITERKQAEAEREELAREQTARAEAEHAAERIRRLQAVTDSALAHPTLDDLLYVMLARIRELLETDSAAILMLTEDGRSLVVRATIGLEEDVVGLEVPVGEGVPGSIAASRAPLIVEELSVEDVINLVLRQSAHSLIGAPLIVKGEFIGVIHANTIQLRRFAESDVRLLQLAADRVALAVEQRSVYEVEQQARRQAEEASRMKDEFLAIVSHELRSPLNAIIGYTRMLRSGSADRGEINRATAIIERNAKAQLNIIEDLLDTARVITGKLRIERSQVDLAPALEAALDTARGAAEAKGVTLVADFGPLPEETLGDSTRLQQIVWNLLANAVKFTPEGGRVELRMEGAADNISITVSDNGRGIEPESLPFVFDRFWQADSSGARRYGGLGLGLSLVKHLVELHGGTITVASEGLGRGATFTVTLPRLRLEIIAPQTPAVIPREARTEGAIALDETLSLDGVGVLVVDDQEEARTLLIQALSEYGAQVTAVSSGVEALALLADPPGGRRPDALILDIAMPDEDGYTALKNVRALEAWQGIVAGQLPAIALTAHGRTEDRLRALQAGFQMHVAKPVEPAELAVVIASLTHRRGKLT